MIEINLLPEELKEKPKTKKIGVGIEAKYYLYLIPLIVLILFVVHTYLAVINITKGNGLRQLNKKWQSLEPQRKMLENLKKERGFFSSDAGAIQQLASQRIYWSEKLNKLSLNLPPGVWFNEISVNSSDFVLRGSAVSLEKEEMNLIKKFIDNLKNDKGFISGFRTFELGSVGRRTLGSYDIVDFTLTGQL